MKVSMPLYSKRTRLDHKYRLDKIEKAVGKARFLGYNLFHEIRNKDSSLLTFGKHIFR